MSYLSSMHHSFDMALAVRFGVEEAILIHHFQHWIRINRANQRNIKEGRCWTYQTRKDIAAKFPYWNYDRVKYLCEKLVKDGVLITGCFNKSPIDKTLWYGFVDEKAFAVDEGFSKNLYEGQKCPSKGKSALPIPDTITTYTKIRDISPKKPKPQKEAKEGFGSVVKLSRAEHSNLVAFMGIEALNELIERANEYCEINDRKYSNYFALLKAWHKRDLKNPKFSKKSQGDKNKILAQKIIEKYGDSRGVHISENALVFPNQGAGGDFFFKFDIPNFEGQVRNRMELMRLVFPI